MIKRNEVIHKALLIAIVVAFLAGVFRLLILRFEAGDIYPIYSSLRSDPLGTKILYEGLDDLERLTVSRNYHSRLKDFTGATVFYFGTSSNAFCCLGKEEAAALEETASAGNRIVFLLFPEENRKSHVKKLEAKNDEKEADADKNEKDKEPENSLESDKNATASLNEKWKFNITDETDDQERTDDNNAHATGAHNLPASISWHSSNYFSRLGEDWETVYESDGRPVIVERSFGKGTIVIATDTYFVSNEAMLMERHPDLLTWLVGANSKIVFDESHLGVTENPGIASLAKKYRLQWILGSAIFTAVLIIWKHSSRFLPPYSDEELKRLEQTKGKGHLAGFAGLLRRNIPSGNILAVCHEEWRKTVPNREGDSDEELKLIKTIISNESGKPAKERDPVKAYRQIAKLLTEGRGHHEQ